MESKNLGGHYGIGLAALFLVACANGGGPPTGGNRSTDGSDSGSFANPPPVASDCGNLGSPCCSGRCEGDLSCIDGICGQEACGALGEPCCGATPACFSGLTCTVDGCTMQAPSTCGGAGEACCAGVSPCGSGLECLSGACMTPTPPVDSGTPPPPDSGTPPPVDSGTPPPPADPCASATNCFDCTDRADCGFCDGRCVLSDFFGPLDGSFCGSFSWVFLECI